MSVFSQRGKTLKNRFFGLTALFLWLGLLIACAVNPVTGKRELSLISEPQEIALGQESDQQIRAQFGVYDDPALTAYVERLGESLVPHSHRPQLDFHFAVLDTPVINAFAVPGGYIYVTRGILSLMSSEAELIVVLGHEIGHVTARHSVRKMSQLMLVQLGLVVGSALSETFADLAGAASIGVQLLFLKFSRDDERQADALGVEYSRKGGYNPGEMIDFFSSLQKLGDLSGGGQRLPGFLSTHPLTSERIENTKSMLMTGDAQLKVDARNYMAKIDNMVYGEDPRQGFVEGQAFYHPLLRFTFSVPSGWKVQNSPSQVVLAEEKGNAAVILQAETSAENVRDYGRKKIESLEGRTYLDERQTTINGFDSYMQYFDLTQKDQTQLRVIMTFIRKEQLIYTFSSLSTVNDFGKYDFQFGTIVGSFKQLDDPNYLNRQPKRLRIVRASGRDTLATIFERAGIDQKAWPQFAIMNGMEVNQVPVMDREIKIIQ